MFNLTDTGLTQITQLGKLSHCQFVEKLKRMRLPSKQRVVGSNPARDTFKPSQGLAVVALPQYR